MTEKNYTPPKLHEKRFHCPHCGTFAAQGWNLLYCSQSSNFSIGGCNLWISSCSYSACRESCLWMGEKMVYPNFGKASQPNDDLSEEVKKIYGEAALVLPHSPRAAAALLRLALQELCKEHESKGDNLVKDIKDLVESQNLSDDMKKIMDTVRIVGNKAVHPGEIDLNDTRDIVEAMFEFINYIAEKVITEPKKRNAVMARFEALTSKPPE